MSVKTKPWDSAATLRDDQDIVAYLEAAFEDASETGDFSIVSHAIGTVAKAKGMTQVSRDSGLNRESLYKALSEKGNPSFETVMKVISALNLQIELKPRRVAA